MTNSCPGCGATAPAEARYCRHCGAALRHTTTGNVGAETVSPLAATAPLPEQRLITGELDTSTPYTSTQLNAPDAAVRTPQLPVTNLGGDNGEITISVVRPLSAQTSIEDAHTANSTGPASRPAATSATTSSSATSSSATASSPTVAAPTRPPKQRTTGLWLAAGLIGAVLLCGVAVGLWFMLRPQHVPVVSEAAPAVVASAATTAQAKIAEAQSLLSAGNPVEATARLREAVALDPTNAEAHRQLAGLLLESGARQTAIEELRAVTRLEPNDKDAWRQLAEAQFAEGAYADAADSYHTLTEVSNEALADDRLQLAYADALRLAGRTDYARALYQRLAASPLADVALTSKQRLTSLSASATTEVAVAPARTDAPTATSSPRTTQPVGSTMPPATLPRPNTNAPNSTATLSPAERYQRGVNLLAGEPRRRRRRVSRRRRRRQPRRLLLSRPQSRRRTRPAPVAARRTRRRARILSARPRQSLRRASQPLRRPTRPRVRPPPQAIKQ